MKIRSNLPTQKPLAAMYNRVPSMVIVDFQENSSIIASCKSGSTLTSLQTSLRSVAVMSLISLCRREGKPPREQKSTCSTVKLAPHTQLFGILEGVHPYLKARASTKAPLCREKPCSSSGIAVSQLEELSHVRDPWLSGEWG